MTMTMMSTSVSAQ